MKKRLMVGLLSAGLVLAMAVPAVAAEPGPDINICHIPEGMDAVVQIWGGYTLTYRFGKLETVGERAVAAHRAHGDPASYIALTPSLKTYFVMLGARFEDWADCYFYTYVVN